MVLHARCRRKLKQPRHAFRCLEGYFHPREDCQCVSCESHRPCSMLVGADRAGRKPPRNSCPTVLPATHGEPGAVQQVKALHFLYIYDAHDLGSRMYPALPAKAHQALFQEAGPSQHKSLPCCDPRVSLARCEAGHHDITTNHPTKASLAAKIQSIHQLDGS